MTNSKLLLRDSDPEVQADKFVKQAILALEEEKPKKKAISIRLDHDVLAYLRETFGRKYQHTINTVLRTFTEYPVDKLSAALDQEDYSSAVSKEPISIRLDEYVLIWFKSKGDGYQTRINNVLRVFMVYSKTASVRQG